MPYTLIQTPSGDRLLVTSLDGHDGCSVVAKNIPEPPSPFHRLDAKGKWVEDSDAREKARLQKMSRAELAEYIMARVNTANLASGPKG